MMRTRVKMCGMTRPVDVAMACELGVDAVGLVFCPTSPRYVELSQARELIGACSPLVNIVALFRNPKEKEVKYLLDELTINYLQFHGDEPSLFCASFNTAYIKAIAMGGTSADVTDSIDMFDASADALLFDSHSRQKAGGSGETFDWSQVPGNLRTPMILAGGLRSDNIAVAIDQLRPYAVDVSSGIESAKGVKDHRLMRDFMTAVRAADIAVARAERG